MYMSYSFEHSGMVSDGLLNSGLTAKLLLRQSHLFFGRKRSCHGVVFRLLDFCGVLITPNDRSCRTA